MGLFKNLNTAKLKRDFVYEEAGAYIERIDRVIKGETRTREIFISIEKTVLVVLPTHEAGPFHPVGEEINHFIKVTGSEYADREWAGFMCGIFGCQTADLVPALFNGMDSDDWACNDNPAVGPVQPLRGMVVEMNNRLIPLKEKPGKEPGSFTRIGYRREVPAAEVLKLLTPDQITRFFPGQMLERAAGLVK